MTPRDSIYIKRGRRTTETRHAGKQGATPPKRTSPLLVINPFTDYSMYTVVLKNNLTFDQLRLNFSASLAERACAARQNDASRGIAGAGGFCRSRPNGRFALCTHHARARCSPHVPARFQGGPWLLMRRWQAGAHGCDQMCAGAVRIGANLSCSSPTKPSLATSDHPNAETPSACI